MTKKDYELIAKVLWWHYDLGENATHDDLVKELARVFSNDNPKFDRCRFLHECGLPHDDNCGN